MDSALWPESAVRRDGRKALLAKPGPKRTARWHDTVAAGGNTGGHFVAQRGSEQRSCAQTRTSTASRAVGLKPTEPV
jgi:hypothetical protein